MDDPTYVDITTKEFVTVETSNKIAIYVLNIELFNKATIHVHFLNADDRNIHLEVLEMTGDDYSAWGTDDQYVVTWTLNKLGLSPTTQVVV